MYRLTTVHGACARSSSEFCEKHEDCYSCSHERLIRQRLAAYEGTDLTPQEIKAPFTEQSVLKLAAQVLGTTPERLREMAQPQWISVKDKLPPLFVSVLCYMPGMEPFPTVREGYLSAGGFYIPALLEHVEVTSWAEMPEPPKED